MRLQQIIIEKKIDGILQGVAFLGPLLCCIFEPTILFVTYFTVGGVQFLSCLKNMITLPRGARARSRRGYEILLLIVIVLFFGSWALGKGEIAMIEAAALLAISPLMAIWYFAITISELRLAEEAMAAVKRLREYDVQVLNDTENKEL